MFCEVSRCRKMTGIFYDASLSNSTKFRLRQIYRGTIGTSFLVRYIYSSLWNLAFSARSARQSTKTFYFANA